MRRLMGPPEGTVLLQALRGELEGRQGSFVAELGRLLAERSDGHGYHQAVNDMDRRALKGDRGTLEPWLA